MKIIFLPGMRSKGAFMIGELLADLIDAPKGVAFTLDGMFGCARCFYTPKGMEWLCWALDHSGLVRFVDTPIGPVLMWGESKRRAITTEDVERVLTLIVVASATEYPPNQ